MRKQNQSAAVVAVDFRPEVTALADLIARDIEREVQGGRIQNARAIGELLGVESEVEDMIAAEYGASMH